MKFRRASGLFGVLLLSGVQPASALEQISVECIVEIAKNDIVEQKLAGPCWYGMPFVVRPSESPRGGNDPQQESTKAELHLQGVKDATVVPPGLYANVHLGNNLSDQNPKANVSIEYVLVTTQGVQKVPVLNENNKVSNREIPIQSKVFGSGNSVFRKGEVGRVSSWIDGPDTYQVRIGLR